MKGSHNKVVDGIITRTHEEFQGYGSDAIEQGIRRAYMAGKEAAVQECISATRSGLSEMTAGRYQLLNTFGRMKQAARVVIAWPSEFKTRQTPQRAHVAKPKKEDVQPVHAEPGDAAAWAMLLEGVATILDTMGWEKDKAVREMHNVAARFGGRK